jgi:hypothetical protein
MASWSPGGDELRRVLPPTLLALQCVALRSDPVQAAACVSFGELRHLATFT